tara:strand:+ start:131 stop:436 length:306 start_codon:yes stop_codon:yes gene_type:complete
MHLKSESIEKNLYDEHNYLILRKEVLHKNTKELKIDIKQDSNIIDQIITLFFKKDIEPSINMDQKYTLIIYMNAKEYLKIYSYDSEKLNKLFRLFHSELLK